jgi:hypothetical protein
MSEVGAPSIRFSPAMVWSGSEMLVWGGYICDPGCRFLNTGGRYRPASASVPSDTTPPEIKPTVTGTLGEAGWYTSDASVSWSVTDSESPLDSTSGCDSTTLTADTPGTTLTCRATSAGGTSEKSVSIKIDKTKPTVIYSGNAGTYTVDQTVSISCTAADQPNLSGIASTTCRDINGPAYAFNVGINSFSATATDKAGNVGNGSTSFTVQVTAAGIDTLIRQFVTNPGQANSLIQKIDGIASAPNAHAKDGKLGAFKNEVAAQTGKALTADQAAILTRLAGAL